MKRWIPKRKYVRIFLALCLLLSLVSIPFVYVVSSQLSAYATRQIDKANEVEASHAEENARFVFAKMTGYGLNMYQDKSIQLWLTDGEETPAHQVDAMKAASNYAVTEPYIDNIYLFNMRTGYALDLKFGLAPFGKFADQAALALIRSPRKSYLNFQIYETDGGRKLALVIPTVPSGQESFGYLVMLLKQPLMQQYLLKDDAASGLRSFILDRDGNVMLGANDAPGLYADLAAEATRGKGSFSREYGGERWSVQYADIEPQGWTLYRVVRYDRLLADFDAFRDRMFGFAAAFALVSLGILFWSSRRAYKPITRLAERLETKLGRELRDEAGPREEYRVIQEGIDLLADRVDQMDASMREHRNVVREEYLRQWIAQGKANAQIEKVLREETGLFEGDRLRLAVIRIHAYSLFEDTYNIESRRLLKYAAGNIAEELANRHASATAVDMGGDHLVLLVAGEPRQADRLIGTLEEAGREIARWTKIETTIAVGEPFSASDDLRGFYLHVRELTMLRFLSGEDKVYTERDFEAFMERVRPLPDDALLDGLIKQIRLGKAEEAEALLGELIAPMRTMRYAESKFQLSLVLYTLFKTFNRLPSVESAERIESLLDRFDTLAGIQGWLAEEIRSIVGDLAGRKGASRRDEVVAEIVAYVKTRLHDPLLTIDEIAEHVSLSARYARQLFKEAFDATLSDYIMDERIARVKELLETTDAKATDIGERAGFQTKSHFFTAFKKATGLTPNQYREQRTER